MTDLADLATVEKQFGVNDGARRIIRRQRIFLAIASAAALISVAGLTASTLVKSPAQLAADQGPPSPSALTAAVVSQVLTKTVVVRGTVVAGSSVAVTPTAAQGATALVVTRLTKHAGDAVAAGDVIVEVSGRPVVVLPGNTPAYRDLKPGDSGSDITELQAALRSLGYADADAGGVFGTGTKRAVSDLYRHLGYSVPTTGGPDGRGDAQALQGAAQAVTAAQRTVDADTVTVTRAQAKLAAEQTANPPDQAAIEAAKQALADAQQTLTYAKQDLTTARQAQTQLIATTGVQMPLNEFVFVPSLPARIATVKGDVGSVVSAPLVTMNTGALVVTSVLQQGDQSLVKSGVAVQLTAEALNQQATGTLTTIGPYSAGSQQQTDQGQDQSQQGGAAQRPGYPITVTPGSALPGEWLGQDVRVTIQAASTPGPVLVVPVAAVSTSQDGTTAVTVLRNGNIRVRVPVTAGLDANGLVEVTTTGGATLAAGDLVVVG